MRRVLFAFVLLFAAASALADGAPKATPVSAQVSSTYGRKLDIYKVVYKSEAAPDSGEASVLVYEDHQGRVHELQYRGKVIID